MKLRVSRYVSDRVRRGPNDFRLDTFKSGGKGGQHQNKTESGVRITCLITGFSAECREHRNQGANRKSAFEKLILRLVEHFTAEEARLRENVAKLREVRVYREIDGKVRDHRVPGKTYDYDRILEGKDLPGVIRDVIEQQAAEGFGA